MGATRKFGKRRWRRPERMTLDGPPVVRRKDLGVSEPLPLEPELARKTSRRHIELLLASFAVLTAAEGVLIGLVVGHPILGTVGALVFGALYFFVAREFGDSWIVRALRAGPVEGPRALRLASSEAKSAGIPAPNVLVAPGEVPNALSFALRRRWVVTTQACETLDELALEGLLAHEVVHLRDGESTSRRCSSRSPAGPTCCCAAPARSRRCRCRSGRSRSSCGCSRRGSVPRMPNTERISPPRSSRAIRRASRRRFARPGGRAAG